MLPPIAQKKPKALEIHGDVRQDPYYWLNEKENPEVIAYLEAENDYYKQVMTPLEARTNALYEKLIDRIPPAEVHTPIQNGPYFYYARSEKELQYPIFARKLAASREELEHATEEVILDVNELAKDAEYFNITEQRISKDHNILAYLENRDGTDHYTLRLKDLQTDTHLEDRIDHVYIYGSIEFSACGNYIFYVTVDDQQRPTTLWRHKIGTDVKDDVKLFEETDVTYTLYVSKTFSKDYIVVYSSSTMTTETQLINAHEPLSAPVVFQPRQTGVEYEVEHKDDTFYILTNENAENFQLQQAPTTDPTNRTNVIPYDDTYFLESVYPFRDALVVTGRAHGLTQIWTVENGTLSPLEWEEDVYNVSLLGGQHVNTSEILVRYESLRTPKVVYGFDAKTFAKKIVDETMITGTFEKENYVQKQLWATAEDGVKVPLLVIHHKDALQNGPAPLVLNAYGSYGACSDPSFSVYRLPLLDEGVIVAIAQVRGGSEMGRNWYETGKLNEKRNTFTDFIACGRHLVAEGYTTPEKMAARGGSAGGLLMGAVANMAPELFHVIAPAVPFVDVVTTMLDESIPLTTLEWDEWGNPKEKEAYDYMKSYSPYDNVEAKDYPHLYITTGLNDPRVGYFEPAKWVAKLRHLKTDSNEIVLKTNMGAGHFGSSGRFNMLKEVAEEYAFILDKIQ